MPGVWVLGVKGVSLQHGKGGLYLCLLIVCGG